MADPRRSWLDANAEAPPDAPAGGQGTGVGRPPASPLIFQVYDRVTHNLQRITPAFLSDRYKNEKQDRQRLATEIKKLGDTCARYSDELRGHLPAGPLRYFYDWQIGGIKGEYGFVESLISGAVDIGLFVSKLLNPIYWLDPELHQQLRTFGEYGYIIGNADYVIRYGSVEQKVQLIQAIHRFAVRAYTAASDSLKKDWTQAVADGKQAELINKWLSRITLEVGSLFIGVGEAKTVATMDQALEATHLIEGAAYANDTKAAVRTLKTAEEVRDAVRVEQTAAESKAAGDLAQGGRRGSVQKVLEGAGADVRPYEPTGQVLGQRTGYTCVAASCRMVAEDVGVSLSEETLAEALKTTPEGAALKDAPEALGSLGVSGGTMIRGGTVADLEAAVANGKSAIVGVDVPGIGGHAMVVDGVADGVVYLRDPLPVGDGSSFAIPVKDFLDIWRQGKMVIF